MVSSEYLTWGSFCFIHTDSRVKAPSLPVYMTRMMTNFPAVLKSGVMPVESPTVPKAETTSKISCIRVQSGSRIHMRKVATQTTAPESSVIMHALKIFCLEMLRWKV